jgi:hypothetical protein
VSAERRRRGRHAKSARAAARLGPEAKTSRDAMITLAGGLGRGDGLTADGATGPDGPSAATGASAATPGSAATPRTAATGASAANGAPARTGATARGGTRGDQMAMAVAGTAAVATAVAVAVFWGGPKPAKPTAAAPAAAAKSAAAARSARQRAAPVAPLATAPGAAAGDADADPGAIAYYKEKEPQNKVAKHVDEVRWSGRYLRVYTDLKEGDTHSRVALDLCKWTSEYLTDRRGDRDPVVFVHAKKNDNGNVVLVNKLSAKDPCKSVETQ